MLSSCLYLFLDGELFNYFSLRNNSSHFFKSFKLKETATGGLDISHINRPPLAMIVFLFWIVIFCLKAFFDFVFSCVFFEGSDNGDPKLYENNQTRPNKHPRPRLERNSCTEETITPIMKRFFVESSIPFKIFSYREPIKKYHFSIVQSKLVINKD